jgi:hypothetical protein
LVPTSYEIRIKGRLGEPMVAAFGGFTASVRAPETILSTAIPDQHALYQLLDRIRSLELELLEVRKLPDPDDYDRWRGIAGATSKAGGESPTEGESHSRWRMMPR